MTTSTSFCQLLYLLSQYFDLSLRSQVTEAHHRRRRRRSGFCELSSQLFNFWVTFLHQDFLLFTDSQIYFHLCVLSLIYFQFLLFLQLIMRALCLKVKYANIHLPCKCLADLFGWIGFSQTSISVANVYAEMQLNPKQTSYRSAVHGPLHCPFSIRCLYVDLYHSTFATLQQFNRTL